MPAVSDECKEQLQQLEHYCQVLLEHVQHIEVRAHGWLSQELEEPLLSWEK